MRFRAPLLIAALVTVPVPVASGQAPCEPWSMRTVVAGLGSVENLEPDGTGGMLISASSRSAIERVAPDGTRTTVAANVSGPGGLRVQGQTLYAVTGGSLVNALLAPDQGKVETFDLRTGLRSTYSQGLPAPNGLVFENDGDGYVSRDVGEIGVDDSPINGIGTDMFITRIPAGDPLNPDTTWAHLEDTNGLAIDKTGTWLYASTTFNMEAAVFRVSLDDPSIIEKVAELGSTTDPLNGLDDMTIGNDGVLYLTANGMGRVWSLDPDTGERCIIASGLQNPTAVKFGRGPGWPADHLFVTGFDGRLRELIPPN